MERALHGKRAKSFPGPFDTSLTLIGYATREDWREAITQSFVDTSMLKRVETLDDAGNVAAFVASDLARTITATTINITCGRVAD